MWETKKSFILLFIGISCCEALTKYYSRVPAHTLAAQTGAARYEEHFELVPPAERRHHLRKRASNEDYDYEVYQGVVGRPGIDFPILPRIPQTSFSCRTFGNGYFADLETDCQVFHICEEGRKISFLCPNGTIFQQSELTCDWWFKVNCAGSPGHYAESSEQLIRAQNRGKYRQQSVSKNEFHSGEREHTSRVTNKNQYPEKPTHRKSNRNKIYRRIDSDELPISETFDFDDLSLNHGSSEKVSEKLRFHNEDEAQELAESASFVTGKNNNQRKNGYVYNNPQEKNKVNAEKNQNSRGRQKFEDQNNYLDSSKISGQNQNKAQISNNKIGKIDLIHQPQKFNPIFENSTEGRPLVQTTIRKLENSKTTPYYTPTVPTLTTKFFKPSNVELTTTKYLRDGNNKKKANFGFSFGASTKLPEISTVYDKNLIITTIRPRVIGLRGNHDNNIQRKVNGTLLLDTGLKSNSFTFNDKNLNEKLETTTTTTTFKGGPTYLPTTTDKSEFTTSTSGPTYLPKATTTPRTSSAGPTYLPTKPSKSHDSVTDHVKDMVRTINDLKYNLKVNTNTLEKDVTAYLGKSARPGLDIPPSSGPETLVSLASYFAGEGDASTSKKIASTTSKNSANVVNVKHDIFSGNLSNKTIKKYEKLFGIKSGISATPLPDVLSPEFKIRAQDDNDLEGQHSNGLLGDSAGKTETRKIAQVFTNALSAYLENPDQFRRVLTEVRPTRPPSAEYLDITGAPATYRKPINSAALNRGTAVYSTSQTTTTSSPEDLEVLDFSDVSSSKSESKSKVKTTTISSPTGTISPKDFDRIPGSKIVAKQKSKIFTTTTDPMDIAVEVNKELDSSTIKSFPLVYDLIAPDADFSTTQQPVSFELLPPNSKKKKDNTFILSSEILAPFEDDGDSLQRAQSQSYGKLRNDKKLDRIGKLHKSVGNSEQFIKHRTTTFYPITSTVESVTSTTDSTFDKSTQNPWSHFSQTAYLDPLTINDALMNEFKTTTTSPYTYLPKKTIQSTTETNPLRVNLNSDIKQEKKKTISSDRTGKKILEVPYLSDDLLPPQDGMQKIAVKMFGGLNDTQAHHLMNVMKKAESNQMVRKLILLLIQTCDDDYSRTVEQSRQALLNALIGMDDKFEFDDEIEIIKLKPRRQKSIGSRSRNNIIESSTQKIQITTYRRPIDVSLTSTTTSLPEETTKFQIRVEDPENYSTESTTESEFSTTTLQPDTSTIRQSKTTTTLSPKSGSRRKPKDLDEFLGQQAPLNFSISNSHKNSDERALELLKSLYSLASKFGKR